MAERWKKNIDYPRSSQPLIPAAHQGQKITQFLPLLAINFLIDFSAKQNLQLVQTFMYETKKKN